MSCEQRENGTFYFKQSGYTEIMRTIRGVFQEFDAFRFEIAVSIYDALKLNKIKKNKKAALKFLDTVGATNKSNAADMHAYNHRNFATLNNNYELYLHTHYINMLSAQKISNPHRFEIDKQCIALALDEIFRNENNTMLKPRRTAFPKLTNKDKSFSREFGYWIQISLDGDKKTINWSVESGNRSVDNSEDHYMTKIFFSLLDSYNWKIGEHGETVCVAESFDDDPCSADSEAYTTRSYIKLSKKQLKEKEKFDQEMRKHEREMYLYNRGRSY
jgi:hypothetical protein